MSTATVELCQSLQMMDRKTDYVLEAVSPCSSCKYIQIGLCSEELKLGVFPKDGDSVVPIHSWKIENDIHIEGMTAEYKNGTLFIRLPKSETQHPRPLQYCETIEITPLACNG